MSKTSAVRVEWLGGNNERIGLHVEADWPNCLRVIVVTTDGQMFSYPAREVRTLFMQPMSLSSDTECIPSPSPGPPTNTPT